MQVVSCVSSTDHIGYKWLLRASCEYHGLCLTTLTHRGRWTSNRLKDELLRSHVVSLKDDEIVLCTDGYDTILTCSTDEILAKYASFGKPIVCSAETNCWPWDALATAYPNAPTRRRFLNSGGFIGTAVAIRALLDRYIDNPPSAADFVSVGSGLADERFRWSNQYLWTLIYLRHQDMIGLDHWANLFLPISTDIRAIRTGIEESIRRSPGTSTGHLQRLLRDHQSALYRSEMSRLAEEFLVADGRLRDKVTGSTPSQVHFTGPFVNKIVMKERLFTAVMPWLGGKTPLEVQADARSEPSRWQPTTSSAI